MTPAGSKAKGRNFENEVVDFLISAGWPYAERRRLAGAFDKGDIAGVPGVTIEAKHHKSYKLPEWSRETEVERKNAKTPIAACFIRQNGKPGADNGFVMLSPQVFVRLLREAGYGPEWVDTVE